MIYIIKVCDSEQHSAGMQLMICDQLKDFISSSTNSSTEIFLLICKSKSHVKKQKNEKINTVFLTIDLYYIFS